MGTCGLVGPIGVYTGWISDVAAGNKLAIGAMDWLALAVVVVILPAILSWAFWPLFPQNWLDPRGRPQIGLSKSQLTKILPPSNLDPTIC